MGSGADEAAGPMVKLAQVGRWEQWKETGSGPRLSYRTNSMAIVRKVAWSKVSLQSRGKMRGELIALC